MFVCWCVGFGEDLCKDQLWTCRYRCGFEFNRDALRPIVIIQHRPGISYKKWYCGQWLLREVVVSGSGTKVYQSYIGNNLTKWNHEGPHHSTTSLNLFWTLPFLAVSGTSPGRHSTNGHVCMNFLCEQNVTVAKTNKLILPTSEVVKCLTYCCIQKNTFCLFWGYQNT